MWVGPCLCDFCGDSDNDSLASVASPGEPSWKVWVFAMNERRNITADRLWQIEASLSTRDKEIAETVGRLGLVTGRQLQLLFFAASESKDQGRRSAQSALKRLVNREVLLTLDRRIGGARSGSSGFVYKLGYAGQRLFRRWQGMPASRSRRSVDPGEPFVAHRIACSQLYVDLQSAEALGDLRIDLFESEPDCWRRRIGPFGKSLTLKPDAHVQLATSGRRLHWFVEIDRGTESQTVIARKGRAYLDHYRSGAEADVMPRVLWLTDSEQRAEQLALTLHALPHPSHELHLVATTNQTIQTLKGESI